MRKVIWRIYVQPLSCVIVEIVLLLVLWGLIGSIIKSKTCWKLLNVLLFVGSVWAILYVTVFTRSRAIKEPIWIPFYSFVEAKTQPERYRTMLMNIFLFQPVGLSAPNIVIQRKHPVLITILFAMLFSMGIEIIQVFFCLGRCEVDDVIMNTVGAAIGSVGCLHFPRRPAKKTYKE